MKVQYIDLRLETIEELALLRRCLHDACAWDSDRPEAEAILVRVNEILRRIQLAAEIDKPPN